MSAESVIEWVRGVLAAAIGAYILFVFVDTACKATPAFCEYGFQIFFAFLGAILLFIKFGPLSR